jgi:hypothetical protein
MPNDNEEFWYKDLNAEADYHQDPLFDDPWTPSKKSYKPKMASFQQRSVASPSVIPDILVKKMRQAIAEEIRPIFQQIMDRLDEIDDGREGAA